MVRAKSLPYARESLLLREFIGLLQKNKSNCKDLPGGFCLLDLEAELMTLQVIVLLI